MAEDDITIEFKNIEFFIIVAVLAMMFFIGVPIRAQDASMFSENTRGFWYGITGGAWQFISISTVSVNSPISFGDEGIHTSSAKWMGENVEYPQWDPILDTKIDKMGYTRPPMWNLLEASFVYIFGYSEFIIKILTPLIAAMAGFALYYTAKHTYNERVGLVSAIILITIPSFVTYSVLFYVDIYLTFLMVMFFFMFTVAHKTKSRLYMLAAGTFAGFIFMTKLTGYSVYMLFGILLAYWSVKDKAPMRLLKQYSPMILMMGIIAGSFLIRNTLLYHTPFCTQFPLVSSFTDRLFDRSGCVISNYIPEYEYEGRTDQVGTEVDVFTMGFTNYLQFAYGPIWFVVLAFLSGLIMALESPYKSETVTIMNTIIFTMLLLFAILFMSVTNRAEDTSRYSLAWTPVISILAAYYFDGIYLFVKKYLKSVSVIIIIVVILLGIYLNAIPKVVGMYQVKMFSPSFFEACDWARENLPEDALITTVWVYRAAYNCDRRVVGSTADMAISNNLTHVLKSAEDLGITHIFIQKFSLSNDNLSEKYPVPYVQLLESNPEYFEKIYENGLPFDQCLAAGGCDGNIIYEIHQTPIDVFSES